NIPVFGNDVLTFDAVLEVGTTSMTVEVTAETPVLMTSNASVSSVISSRDTYSLPMMSRAPKPAAAKEQGTPRVREYLPETLVWSQQLETVDGHANLTFRMADSITTWKLAAIASTLDGTVETTALDMRAFQPLFIDHGLPPILTEGDEIHLPVAVRNYEKK